MNPAPGKGDPRCPHLERENGICLVCGHCAHDVILNGACFYCGTTELDPVALSPKLIPADRLRKK